MIFETLLENITDMSPVGENKRRLVILSSGKTCCLAKYIENNLLNTDCISEHALTFIEDFGEYSSFVILNAESYHGKVFERIFNVLKKVIKNVDNVLMIPLAFVHQHGNSIPKSYIDGRLIDISSKIPSTTQNEYLKAFSELEDTTFDLFVPYFHYGCVNNPEEFVEYIKKNIENEFSSSCKSYHFSNNDKTIEGYSILFDNIFKERTGIQPDFAKLKLYVKRNDVTISPLFISSIWDIDEYCPELNYMSESFNRQVYRKLSFKLERHQLIEEYELRQEHKKTLAIMSNWLQSFFLLHHINKKILQKHEFKTIMDQSKNLSLLLGKKKAETFLENLYSWLKCDGQDFSIFDWRLFNLGPVNIDKSLTNYWSLKFEMDFFDNTLNNTSTKEVLTYLFKKMYDIMEHLSRCWDRKSVECGDSYRHLIGRMTIGQLGNPKERDLELNKFLDEGIANKFIKGSYETDFNEHRQYWLYVFRCDEKID